MHRDRRPEERRLEDLHHKVDEQNEILAEARAQSPALRYLSWIVPALIAVLIATIALSPVELEWTWLLGSLVVGGVLAEVATRLTRAGRLSVRWTQGLRPIRLSRGRDAEADTAVVVPPSELRTGARRTGK